MSDNSDYIAQYQAIDGKMISIVRAEGGRYSVIEDGGRVLQPDVLAEEVMGYLAHVLHNAHYLLSRKPGGIKEVI